MSRHNNNNDSQYMIQTDDDVDGINTLITRQQYKRNKLYLIILGISVIGCVAVIIGLAIDVNHLQDIINNKTNTDITPNKQLYTDIYNNITSNIDYTVDPCDNFYQYACGSWLQSNTLPSDKVSYSRSFTTIADNNQLILQSIAQNEWPLLDQLYDSCMDIDTINSLGYTPIQSLIDSINSITTLNNYFTVYGQLLSITGISLLFRIGIEVDSKNPTINLISIQQGGLSLPSPNYYSGTNNLLDQLQTHITDMLSLIGDTDAELHAQQIIDLELRISEFTLNPDQLRDPNFVYNPIHSIGELNSIADLPWIQLFDSANIKYNPSSLHLNIQVISYIQKIYKLLQSTDIDILKQYTIWHVLNSAADDLSDPIANQHFSFFGTVVRGQKTKLSRTKKCVQELDTLMSDLIGRYYVEQAFPGTSKSIAIQMIQYIKSAFSNRLPELSWMDEITVQKARDKLSQVYDQIGYTDHWYTYDSVGNKLSDHTYYNNILVLNQYNYQLEINKLDHPVDKSDWEMSPPTVNAYYEPSLNSINFPAGILQPPFFHHLYPSAMNYGGIGMVAGHELTHGFDDQGRQYAGNGELIDWWTDTTTQQFQSKATCLINQYSEYIVGSEHLNGNLTLGENIADNGGIRASYNAWKLYETDHGVDEQIDSTITNDQLFFLSYAQDWCQLISPAYAHLLVSIDPHSPAEARVNYPLRNYEQFADTWQCKSGTFMSPVDRCTIW